MFKFPGCLFRLLPAFWAVFLRKACEHILENNSKPHADDPFGVSEAAMWMQLYQAHNYKHNYYSYYFASTCGIASVLVVVILILLLSLYLLLKGGPAGNIEGQEGI